MNEFNFIFSGDKYSVLPYKKDDFNSLLELLQKDIDQVYLTFRIHLDFRVDFFLSVLFHKNLKKHGWGHFDFIIYHHLLVESLRNYSFFIKRAP